MGASETKLPAKNIKKNLILDKEFEDPRFGPIQIYLNTNNNEYVMLKEKVSRSAEEYKKLKTDFRERPNLVHTNLIQLIDYEEISDDFVCGNLNKLIFRFEYHFHDLSKEIVIRRRDGHYFAEEELWYLVDSLVSVFFYLQKHKISLGDIRPSTILLTKTGVVKVADLAFLNDDSSIYFKLFSNSYLENYYVGPEIIDSLKKSMLAPKYDLFKNDVFAFGMTILEAATLEYSSSCYDYNRFSINFMKIEALLDSLSQRYSIFFINFLKDVLQEKEKYRPNFEDLNSLLSPFHSDKLKKPKSKTIVSNQVKFSETAKSPKKKPMYAGFNQKATDDKENLLNTAIDKANENSENNNNRLKQKFLMNENEIGSNLFIKPFEKNMKFYNDSNFKKETNNYNGIPLSLKENNSMNAYNVYESSRSEPKYLVATPEKTQVNVSNDVDYRTNIIKTDNWQSENDRLNEIERKINEALRLSEETIKTHEIKREPYKKY